MLAFVIAGSVMLTFTHVDFVTLAFAHAGFVTLAFTHAGLLLIVTHQEGRRGRRKVVATSRENEASK